MKNWIEISADHLANNLRAITTAAAGAEVLAVIKADAYGHGATLCAPILTQAGARWLGVTDVEEGTAVRAALGEHTTRIMVMRGIQPEDATAILTHDLTPVIWTSAQLAALEAAARTAERKIPVHIEVDTGMSRQGVATGAALRSLAQHLAASPSVICEGIMTHLCCSEVSAASTTTHAQQLFAQALAGFAAAGLRPTFVHIGNTSAVDEGGTMSFIREQAATLNAKPMVRTGLAVYGYCLPLTGSDSPQVQPTLQPVMTWKATVLDIRDIAPGATVGYGATFAAAQPMRLALIPIGYADGFRREASFGLGNGWVIIHGARAAVVGRVSMNLIVVDVTHISAVTPGTEVTLLGKGVTAQDHALWANTIPYEILCALRSPRLLR